jgi:methionine synthase I (cobalamin-dependent)
MDYKSYEFIGDSMLMRFQRYKLKRKVQCHGTIRRIGFCQSGATPQMVIDNIKKANAQFKSVILMVGTNCLYGMSRATSTEKIEEAIDELLMLLRSRGKFISYNR